MAGILDHFRILCFLTSNIGSANLTRKVCYSFPRDLPHLGLVKKHRNWHIDEEMSLMTNIISMCLFSINKIDSKLSSNIIQIRH